MRSKSFPHIEKPTLDSRSVTFTAQTISLNTCTSLYFHTTRSHSEPSCSIKIRASFYSQLCRKKFTFSDWLGLLHSSSFIAMSQFCSTADFECHIYFIPLGLNVSVGSRSILTHVWCCSRGSSIAVSMLMLKKQRIHESNLLHLCSHFKFFYLFI